MIPALHLLCAKLSLAVYEIDEEKLKTDVIALGVTYICRIATEECVVMMVDSSFGKIVVIQGTRFSENTDASEIWDDLDDGVVDLGDKGMVHAGFYRPLAEIWPDVTEGIGDVSIPVTLTGHSLGGVRAHLAMGLCRDEGRPYSCISFGAPSGASDTYWKTLAVPARYVHGRDFAPDWPPTFFIMKKWSQPGALLWLFQDKMVNTDTRSGINLSLGDHDISAYIAAMEPLTEA